MVSNESVKALQVLLGDTGMARRAKVTKKKVAAKTEVETRRIKWMGMHKGLAKLREQITTAIERFESKNAGVHVKDIDVLGNVIFASNVTADELPATATRSRKPVEDDEDEDEDEDDDDED